MKDRYRTDLFVQHLYKDYPGKLRFDPQKIQTREAFFRLEAAGAGKGL